MAKNIDFKKAAANAFLEDREERLEIPDQEKEIKSLQIPARGGVVKLESGYYRLPKSAETVETKTKRAQLVFRPSLLKAAKAEAKREGTSLNELVHIALKEFLASRGIEGAENL